VIPEKDTEEWVEVANPEVATEIDSEATAEIDAEVEPESESESESEPEPEVAPEEVAPVPSVDPEKIYCEVYRHPDGYNAACRGTENKKLSALEDDDDTDDLVPVQIDVARDGINYACKGVVQKTQPNEDGSVKTILAEDLDCEILE